MTPTRQLIKAAVDNLSADFDKIAVVPVEGGQIPPPQGAVAPPMPPGMSPGMAGDPAAMGGMPPGAPPMDPAMMGGMPPMDPAMMGGMPPMDPAMMGGAPPADAGAPPPPPADAGAGNPSDPAVPLSAIASFTTAIIEATKGKRTADPKDPNAAAPAGEDPAAAGGLPSAIASLGGAPAESPMPLPGLPPAAGKAARALDEILHGIRTSRGYSR